MEASIGLADGVPLAEIDILVQALQTSQGQHVAPVPVVDAGVSGDAIEQVVDDHGLRHRDVPTVTLRAQGAKTTLAIAGNVDPLVGDSRILRKLERTGAAYDGIVSQRVGRRAQTVASHLQDATGDFRDAGISIVSGKQHRTGRGFGQADRIRDGWSPQGSADGTAAQVIGLRNKVNATHQTFIQPQDARKVGGDRDIERTGQGGVTHFDDATTQSLRMLGNEASAQNLDSDPVALGGAIDRPDRGQLEGSCALLDQATSG